MQINPEVGGGERLLTLYVGFFVDMCISVPLWIVPEGRLFTHMYHDICVDCCKHEIMNTLVS